MPNYNQSVLIKEVKACFAVIIACASLFSSSGCEARQTEAPDEPEKGPEAIDNNHENQYEAALGDIISSDKQEPEAEEPENNEHIVEEEAIKAEEAEKERLEEEARRKAEEEEKKQNLNDKLSGINTVTNSIIDFEDSCNKALEQKIQNAKTKDEVDELKALLAYYHKSVRVNVTFFATEQNVTEESFLRLPAELVEKEKELGLDQEIADTSTEAETNHQNINIRDFEKYFGR